MSDHNMGYTLADFIEKIGERGIVDFEKNPKAPGQLVRLANDLVNWEMAQGNPGEYIMDANTEEIGGELGLKHGFCTECGHQWSNEVVEAKEEDEPMGMCTICEDERPNTWRGTGRPVP